MSGSEVLSTLLASEVRGDILVLFHRNPGLIDTVDGVARFLDRAKDRELLESVANHLKTVRIGGEK